MQLMQWLSRKLRSTLSSSAEWNLQSIRWRSQTGDMQGKSAKSAP